MDQQIQPVEQISASSDPNDPAEGRVGGALQVWRWLKRHVVFVATVLVPTLTAIAYFGLIASDVYISESRFLVRSPQQRAAQTGGVLGALLQGTGLSRSQDDTYSVRDFILSRDALQELDQKLAIRKSYSSHDIDWFDRFAPLSWDRSFEALYRYYGKHVTVEYDPTSSISILTVRAFTADDAQKINQQLLEMSERLVNSLNDRSRHDLIKFAQEQVNIAAAKARDASLALLAFRRDHAVFEPDKQAAIQLEGVAKLQEELVSTEAQLSQLTKLSPSNPQIPGLQSRAETLRSAIASEASKVTDGKGSFSAHAASFERLEIESEFADKQLGEALAELAEARSEAVRKQLYLDRLVKASLPDKAMEPRRIRSAFTVFLFGLVLWGTASLVLAAIHEHRDE
jgi:capsular polysaccharide transport system permease protein